MGEVQGKEGKIRDGQQKAPQIISNEGRHTAYLGDEPQKGVKMAAFRSPLIVFTSAEKRRPPCVKLGTIKTDRLLRFLLERSAAKDVGRIYVRQEIDLAALSR